MIKNVLKKIMQISSLVIVFPFALFFLIFRNKDLFISIGQFLSLIPGKIGGYLRAAYYCITLKKSHISLYVGFCTYFSNPDAEVGKNVYISSFCIIGNVRIGCNVGISPYCQILSGRHQHANMEKDVPFLKQKSQVFNKINIGSNSWIGQASIVMANIGKQNIIGAGSVVTKETKDYEIHAGNPARFLRKIFE